MVGAIAGDAVMRDKPVGRGYVEISETSAYPWPGPGKVRGTTLRAHEFHYSGLENVHEGTQYAFEVKRGYGVDGQHDGIVHRNVVASYIHRRNVAQDHWAARFVAFVRRVKRAAGPVATNVSPPRTARTG